MVDMYFDIIQRILIGLVVAGFLSLFFIYIVNLQVLKNWMKKHHLAAGLVRGLKLPIQFLIWLHYIFYSFSIIKYNFHIDDLIISLDKIQLLILSGTITWAILRCKIFIKEIWLKNEQMNSSRSLIETVNKFSSFLIFLISGLTNLKIIGIPIESFLAVGAVGAAGIAWASTDVIKNFFGGVMVHITRPFAIGDWISSPEKNIEGVVEEIGWYQTRIMSFDMRPFYVPNGVFPSIVLQNPSRMANRQITADICLRHEDANQINSITSAVEKMLRSHSEIDTARALMVHLVRFGPYSLDINVYCYTKTVKWAAWRIVQQEIFLKIAEIIEFHGAKFAIPTQAIKFNNLQDASERENIMQL